MSYSYGLSDNGHCTPLGGASIDARYISLIFFAGLKASGLCIPITCGEEGSGNIDDVTYNPLTGELVWTGTNSGSYSITGAENLQLMNALYVQSTYTNTEFEEQMQLNVNEILGRVRGLETSNNGIILIMRGMAIDYFRPMAGLLAIIGARCKLMLSLLMSYFRMLGLSRKQLAFWKENVRKDALTSDQLDDMYEWSLNGDGEKSFLSAPVDVLVDEDSSALVDPDKGKPRKKKQTKTEDEDELDVQHPEIIEVE